MERIRMTIPITNLMGAAVSLLALVALIILSSVYYNPSLKATIDMSWPNCKSLPSARYSSVILGVNGGLDFTANPCLGSETQTADSYGLYLNTGDPGFPRISQVGTGPFNCRSINNLVCYSFNYGYQAARYSLAQANLAGAHSPQIWLDVETINSWTLSKAANRADLLGMMSAIRSSGIMAPRIGIYTANQQWLDIVGKWNANLPLWLGTGDTTLGQAINSCTNKTAAADLVSITQYTVGNLDYNYYCQRPPAMSYFGSKIL